MTRRARGSSSAAAARPKTEAKAKLKEVLRDYEDGLAIAPEGYAVAVAVTDWLAHGLNGRDQAVQLAVHPRTVIKEVTRRSASGHINYDNQARPQTATPAS